MFRMNLQSCLFTTWKWHRNTNKHPTLFWYWNLEENTRCSIISRKHFPIDQNVSPVHRIALCSCIKVPCRFIRHQRIWKPEIQNRCLSYPEQNLSEDVHLLWRNDDKCRCGSREACPPLDPRFWGPKIELLWALFNFPYFFIISLMFSFFIVQIQNFSIKLLRWLTKHGTYTKIIPRWSLGSKYQHQVKVAMVWSVSGKK